MAKYYVFSNATGEYLGTRTPQLDPLESQRAGEDVYMKPGQNETHHAPPTASSNEVAICVDGVWQIKPDYRGEYYSTSNQDRMTIDHIGEADISGYTKKQPFEFSVWNGSDWIFDIALATDSALDKIDAIASSKIYSESRGLGLEYLQVEAAAQSWTVGDPPAEVVAEMEAEGVDAETAKASILAKASNHRENISTLRALRLKAKTDAKVCVDQSEIDAILDSYAEEVSQIA